MEYLDVYACRYLSYINNIYHPLFDFCNKYDLTTQNIYEYGTIRNSVYYDKYIDRLNDIHNFIAKNVKVAKYFIKRGRGINYRSIMCSAKYGHIELVKYLISLGICTVHAMNMVIEGKYKGEIKYLLSLGIENPDLIYDVISSVDIELTRYFISLGIETPKYDMDDIIINSIPKKFLNYLASVGIKYNQRYPIVYGRTHHDCTYYGCTHDMTIKHLISMGIICLEDVSEDIILYGSMGLLKYSLSIHTHDPYLLSVLAEDNDIEKMKFLISLGITAEDDIIHYAVAGNDSKMIKYLLNIGYYEIGIIMWIIEDGDIEIIRYITSLGLIYNYNSTNSKNVRNYLDSIGI